MSQRERERSATRQSPAFCATCIFQVLRAISLFIQTSNRFELTHYCTLQSTADPVCVWWFRRPSFYQSPQIICKRAHSFFLNWMDSKSSRDLSNRQTVSISLRRFGEGTDERQCCCGVRRFVAHSSVIINLILIYISTLRLLAPAKTANCLEIC